MATSVPNPDMMAVAPQANPVSTPVFIAHGSFGEVFHLPDWPLAFKMVLNHMNADLLVNEYRSLVAVYTACNSTSFFTIPCPRAIHVPPSDAQSEDAETFFEINPNVAGGTIPFRDLFVHFRSAAYAMPRIDPLPAAMATFIRQNYFYEDPNHPLTTTGPNLCRLYLGRKLTTTQGQPGRINRFFNSKNFLLDVDRYKALQSAFAVLPPIETVARGMGEMMGRIHTLTGFDAKGVEFVLGGIGGNVPKFWVIDFNQMRRWDRTIADVHKLTASFFVDDPYVPRPNTADPLYQAFKSGYLQAAPYPNLANEFLLQIEDSRQ